MLAAERLSSLRLGHLPLPSLRPPPSPPPPPPALAPARPAAPRARGNGSRAGPAPRRPPAAQPGPRLPAPPPPRLPPFGSGGRLSAGRAAGTAERCEACGKASCLAAAAAPQPCPRRGRGRGGAAGEPGPAREAAAAGQDGQQDAGSAGTASPACSGGASWPLTRVCLPACGSRPRLNAHRLTLFGVKTSREGSLRSGREAGQGSSSGEPCGRERRSGPYGGVREAATSAAGWGLVLGCRLSPFRSSIRYRKVRSGQ